MSQKSSDSESEKNPKPQSSSSENGIHQNELDDYIRTLLRQRFNNMSITEEAMVLMDKIVDDFVERIMAGALTTMRNENSETIELSNVQAAIEQAFDGRQFLVLNPIEEKIEETIGKSNKDDK